MSQVMKKPITALQKAINKHVVVRLKSDIEYKGKMCNIDPYMNLILIDAEEYNKNNLLANYGKVVIRGNNVLFIRIVDDL
ncbi:MAG: U6 snRNA-associated Sm-like protein LSm6 [Nitrososphaerales archaeon]